MSLHLPVPVTLKSFLQTVSQPVRYHGNVLLCPAVASLGIFFDCRSPKNPHNISSYCVWIVTRLLISCLGTGRVSDPWPLKCFFLHSTSRIKTFYRIKQCHCPGSMEVCQSYAGVILYQTLVCFLFILKGGTLQQRKEPDRVEWQNLLTFRNVVSDLSSRPWETMSECINEHSKHFPGSNWS